MVQITSNAQDLVKILKGIPKAMQQVTAATLNDTARAVQVRSERNLKKDMIVRTPYTLKSLKTYKASPGRPIERQDAVTGTISDYLPVHDQGGKLRAKRRRVAIPTDRVRGKDRKKKIPGRYRVGKMRSFVLNPTTKSREESTFCGKTKQVYGRKRGSKVVAYRLERPALFVREGKRLVKVRDLGSTQVKVKGTRWHSEAVERYGNYAYMAQVFRRQAEKFLRTLK